MYVPLQTAEVISICRYVFNRYLFTIVSYLIGVFVFASIVGMSYVVTGDVFRLNK